MDKKLIECVKILWDFNHMNHEIKPADVIIGLGGYDLTIPKRAIELYKNGLSPLILFSGKSGRFTEGVFKKSEAEVFADIAIESGVPKSQILIEGKSTNTGENILCSKQLLQNRKIEVRKVIVVSKPYMERRAYATFKKHWPEVELILTSAQLSYDEYLSAISLDEDLVINTIVTDTQKVKIYSEKGYQIQQDIPEYVWTAWQTLVNAGYDKHVVKG